MVVWEEKEVDIDRIIIPKERVSAYMEESEFEALKTSIDKLGVFAEPLVYEQDGKLILLAGLNRLKALKQLGKQRIKVKVCKGKFSDGLLAHLAENFAKGRISALELYNFIKKITEEQKLTLEEIAKITGISITKLRTALRIANLEDEIKEALLTEQITDSHALLLAQIHDKEQRLDVFEKILTHNLTVEQAKKYWHHGHLQKCDVCGKEGVYLYIMFRGSPQEVWVCEDCLKEQFPQVYASMEAREEEIKKMLESGEISKDVLETTVKCHLCGQEIDSWVARVQTLCKSCNAKLLRLLENFEVHLGIRLCELDVNEIDRIILKIV